MIRSDSLRRPTRWSSPSMPYISCSDLRPGGADSELEPAARQVVDGDRALREQRRVAVGVARDEAADPRAPGCLGHRRLQRPALVDRAVGTAATDGGEVVEIPDMVEPTFVRDAPHAAQRFDRGVLP